MMKWLMGRILGHSTISLTLNTYSHVLPIMSREAANQMDQVLRAAVVTVGGYGEANERVN